MRIDGCHILLLLFLLFVIPAFSQKDSLHYLNSNAISTINMFREQSYITMLGGIGNIERLIFEADIIPYFMLSLNPKAKWGIELSPRIVLRMYNKESYPVRTPSYMPRATFYYQIIDNSGNRKDWFAFISWCHHSNGQDGSFYSDDNKTINTTTGNFATNMMEVGAFVSRHYKKKPYLDNYLKFSAAYHYKQNHDLVNLYGRLRFFTDYKSSLSIKKAINKNNGFRSKFIKGNINQLIRLGWIAGDMNGAEKLDSKRLVFQYTLSLKPAFFNDVTFFAQYYHGQDYYNIFFSRTLNLLRFGIAAKASIFN